MKHKGCSLLCVSSSGSVIDEDREKHILRREVCDHCGWERTVLIPKTIGVVGKT